MISVGFDGYEERPIGDLTCWCSILILQSFGEAGLAGRRWPLILFDLQDIEDGARKARKARQTRFINSFRFRLVVRRVI